jgi:hypothetical protein
VGRSRRECCGRQPGLFGRGTARSAAQDQLTFAGNLEIPSGFDGCFGGLAGGARGGGHREPSAAGPGANHNMVGAGRAAFHDFSPAHGAGKRRLKEDLRLELRHGLLPRSAEQIRLKH